MRTITRRVGRLEEQFQVQPSGEPQTALRVIVNVPWKARARVSTCRRTLSTPGSVLEMVELHGDDCKFSNDELDRFIASFPIERSAAWRPG